ncbi:MAG: ribonuclease H-like domain-containing protein [Thermoanaerobaculia bacterium]
MPGYVAFDLETAKILPADAGRDLLSHRPLGITCAAAVARSADDSFLWHGRDADGKPVSEMSRPEATAIVEELERLRTRGLTLVTWNGLGFDFAVLADSSGLGDRCASLAVEHVDMLFHFVCARGYFASLQKVAEGMGLQGKTAGISGADAPRLWAAGQHDEVLSYCRQDSRTTLEIAETAVEKRRLTWVTRKGTRDHLALPNGWMTVREARSLPLPDTSWMSAPPTRDSFFRWFPEGAAR